MNDLTRWNRAGLRRFRYVDATAVEHFEALRFELARRFPAYADPREASEDAPGRQRRLLEQYQAPTGDPVLELMRVLARATHVLTEHIDAHANEGFIDTATQWDPLRRLVHLLGYHPAPPASAQTSLVVLARPGAAGTLERGFQVRHAPPAGGPPVVFETLQDLELDARLDALRLAGHDRSVAADFDPFGPWAWRREAAMKLSVGQLAVLLQEPQPAQPGVAVQPAVERRARVVVVGALDDTRLGLDPAPAAAADWRLGHTRLLAVPAKVWRPRLNGPGRVELDREPGLGEGDVVVWSDGAGRHFVRVAAAQGRALQLAAALLPPAGTTLCKAGLVSAAGGGLRLPLSIDAAACFGAGGALVPIDIAKDLVLGTLPDGKAAPYYVPAAGSKIVAPVAVFVAEQAVVAGRVAALGSPAGRFEFDGSPTGLASGQWLVANEGSDSGGQPLRRAVRVESIEERDGAFVLELRAEGPAPPEALLELQQRLADLEMALDETVWRSSTLADLAGAAFGTRDVSVIQGVGSVYGQLLRAVRLATVADLAAMSVQRELPGLSTVRLREFRAKALIVLGFALEGPRFASLLGLTLEQARALAAGTAAAPVAASLPVSLERLHGPMRHRLAPPGHDLNRTPVDPADIRLACEPADAPPMKKGRLLVFERSGADGSTEARPATVESMDGNRVLLAAPLPDLGGFTLAETVLRANVVPAGHGETRAEKVLGSGNAALLHQEFRLALAGVSFVADATMPAGVRADLALRVDGRTWQQVGSLADSGPADTHYTVRVTEEGELRIGFGDGRLGRRLPTGSNNVRVVPRVGSGQAGNLPAGSLTQPVRPHRLVAGLRQPLASVGGADLEGVASLRSAAPASVLTLERAVSLADFANLAASHASVAQARAFARPAPRGVRAAVEVVLVPAGRVGFVPGTLQVDARPFDDLLARQAAWLTAHALPGTAVTTRLFEPLVIDLEIEVWIRGAENDTEGVLDAVRAALRARLAPGGRTIGAALHRSELYAAVEAVPGVEYSRCTLTRRDDADARPLEILMPAPGQVVCLHPDRSVLLVAAREYEL